MKQLLAILCFIVLAGCAIPAVQTALNDIGIVTEEQKKYNAAVQGLAEQYLSQGQQLLVTLLPLKQQNLAILEMVAQSPSAPPDMRSFAAAASSVERTNLSTSTSSSTQF